MTARQALDRVAGPLVLFTAIAIALIYWQARHEEGVNAGRDRAAADRAASVAECQGRFNAAVVANIQLRDALRTGRDDATSTVFTRIGGVVAAAQQGDPAELRKAYVDFRDAYAIYEVAVQRLEKAKRNNPLPEFPDCEARAERAHPTPPPT